MKSTTAKANKNSVNSPTSCPVRRFGSLKPIMLAITEAELDEGSDAMIAAIEATN